MRRLLWILLVGSLAAGAAAAGVPDGLTPGGGGRIAEVIDGDTVVLESGRQVRLVGIQAPKLALGRAGFDPWPLAGEARDALEELGLGRAVALHFGGRRIDRHGRFLAHLVRDDGAWLQGELLRRGLARVYSFRDNRAAVAKMLALEAEARAAHRGIWRHPFYAVRPAAAANAVPTDSFELVEGEVLAADVVRGRAYLNFGPDWRRDFTASVAPRDRRLFGREGFDLMALRGRTIRVRGWVKWWNGPMIEITHPEQIEMVP